MKKIAQLLILLIACSAGAQIDRSQQPVSGPIPEINLGVPQTFELPNGLKVLVVENRKLPRVSFTLSIDNPPHPEGDKAGVGQLMGSLLGKGSTNITKDDFNEEVDFMGATINFNPSGGFARGLSKYTDRILELMADAALNPNFTEEEFKKEQDILLESLRTNEKSVPAAARRVESALAYGTSHPYGEFISEETIKNVGLQDVITYYNSYFVPAHAYLVVVGDVSFEEIREKITQRFELWFKASPPVANLPEPRNVQYTQINFVDMPNAVQSEIAVQNLVDLKMSDPDYFPALMANKLLGGSFRSYLNASLREEKGYTYGARSRIGADKYASRFRAGASVRNAVTDSAVVVFMEQLKRIRTEPIDPEDFEIARAEYVGEFVMALEKPETVARYALNILTEDLPADFYSTYLEKLNAVTPEAAQMAAQKFIDEDKARIVITGKGSEVLEGLERLTHGGKSLPILYFDKYANRTEKPQAQISMPEGVSVQSVIEAYFDAIGGAEAIKEIQSLKLVYEGMAMGSTIKTEEIRTAEQYAQTTFMNDAPMMGVIAKGDELYMKQGGNKIPLPPQMQKDMQKAVRGVFPEQAILGNTEAKLTGTEEVEGKTAYRIEIPGETVQTTYFYDMETGLKLKEASVVSMNGQTQNQEVLISGYQEVDGIKFPSVKTQSMGPQQIEVTLIEALVNYDIQEGDFD
jgi:predicted Zn-dependent peptidase